MLIIPKTASLSLPTRSNSQKHATNMK